MCVNTIDCLVLIYGMRIVTPKHLSAFAQRHHTAREALARWARDIEGVDGVSNMADLRNFFTRSVDIIGDLYVFNIGGNKFRLIARIDYRSQRLFVIKIVTHEQYNKLDLKKGLRYENSDY